MASFPGRENSLEEAVKSILPQCDELNIYLNNYNSVPSYLQHPKINVFRSQEELGDLGDVGKFYTVADQDGYIFTVDDKLIYPGNYVAEMISAIEKYNRKAVVSCHGRNVKPNCESYYHDYYKTFRCLDAVVNDEFAHVVGTGVLAWHSSTIEVELSAFKSSNMSDIWFSILLQKEKVPALILNHAARWILMSRKHNERLSISRQCSYNDGPQTAAVNSIKWNIYSCPSIL